MTAGPSVNGYSMGSPLPPEGGHSDGSSDAGAEYESDAAIEANTAKAVAELAKAQAKATETQ